MFEVYEVQDQVRGPDMAAPLQISALQQQITQRQLTVQYCPRMDLDEFRFVLDPTWRYCSFAASWKNTMVCQGKCQIIYRNAVLPSACLSRGGFTIDYASCILLYRHHHACLVALGRLVIAPGPI